MHELSFVVGWLYKTLYSLTVAIKDNEYLTHKEIRVNIVTSKFLEVSNMYFIVWFENQFKTYFRFYYFTRVSEFFGRTLQS